MLISVSLFLFLVDLTYIYFYFFLRGGGGWKERNCLALSRLSRSLLLYVNIYQRRKGGRDPQQNLRLQDDDDVAIWSGRPLSKTVTAPLAKRRKQSLLFVVIDVPGSARLHWLPRR